MHQGHCYMILVWLFSTALAANEVMPLSSELTQFVHVRDFTAFQQEAYFTAQDVNDNAVSWSKPP